MDKDPLRRWTCEQLQRHPYFDNFYFKIPDKELEEFERLRKIRENSKVRICFKFIIYKLVLYVMVRVPLRRYNFSLLFENRRNMMLNFIFSKFTRDKKMFIILKLEILYFLNYQVRIFRKQILLFKVTISLQKNLIIYQIFDNIENTKIKYYYYYSIIKIIIKCEIIV